ncbi:hypothetical protein RB597_006902 [Gaeumannomyces tritici]
MLRQALRATRPRLSGRGMATASHGQVMDLEAMGQTMPPNHKARVGLLDTFELPAEVRGTAGDRAMGKAIVESWRRNGILQIAMSPAQEAVYAAAQQASERFFTKPPSEKHACEITDGVADYSEIFTVTKDLPLDDRRVLDKWPDADVREPMRRYMDYLDQSGEKLLKLTEYGLGVPEGSLTNLTRDGWHHMRILSRIAFSPMSYGKEGRGIGSHTDYGLLVIAAQDHVGGLFVRPPYEGEMYANCNESAAGMKEDNEGWVYVLPVPGVFTVFTGDMVQYMTNSYLPSTPHKVGLNTAERYAFAYFQEPSFQAVCKPLPGHEAGQEPRDGIHYGTHFTNMFLRNYPDRITTQRLLAEGRQRKLSEPALRTMPAPTGIP